MSNTQYFFDTYALFEIVRGVKEYEKYASMNGITTIFNIAELNLNLKKSLSETEADALTTKAFNQTIPVTLEDIQKAMTFKKKHTKLSIPDCVGYMTALKYGFLFLTGDEDFKHLPNVHFVNTRTKEDFLNVA